MRCAIIAESIVKSRETPRSAIDAPMRMPYASIPSKDKQGQLVDIQTILGGVSLAGVTAVVTWIGQAWKYRTDERNTSLSRSDRLAEAQDGLTFQLLGTARTEMAAARQEIEALRDEVQTLRGLELHMFHFQQALDHLEALISARTPEARGIAERNATAFLTRMRRLAEAKGTVRNEAQVIASSTHLSEDQARD